jgi:hypothetical protein
VSRCCLLFTCISGTESTAGGSDVSHCRLDVEPGTKDAYDDVAEHARSAENQDT